MRTRDSMRIAVGAVLMAAIAWGILAAPGFLSDSSSTVVAVVSRQEAH